MKIKRIILLLILLIFLLLLPSIVFFVSNLFFRENFIFANNINKNLELIFKDNDLLKLRKADYYYEIGEYEKAYKKYSEIKCDNKDLCFILNHNIGNATYKVAENLNNLDKLNYWQKSLSYYVKALNIKYDEKTKKNYDFVLDKFNKLKDEIKKQNKEDKTSDSKDNKDKQNKEYNQGDSEKNNNTNSGSQKDVTPKIPSIQIENDEEMVKKALSEEEEKQLDNYIKSLQEEEKQNIELNKPQENRDILDILEEDFFTPFDQKEKDW